MSVYSNIDADAIISACDTAISNINGKNILKTMTGRGLDEMKCSPKSVIIGAEVDAMSNTTYCVSNLKKKIEALKVAAGYVKDYQDAETRYNANKDYTYIVWQSNYVTDSDGNTVDKGKYVTKTNRLMKQAFDKASDDLDTAYNNIQNGI